MTLIKFSLGRVRELSHVQLRCLGWYLLRNKHRIGQSKSLTSPALSYLEPTWLKSRLNWGENMWCSSWRRLEVASYLSAKAHTKGAIVLQFMGKQIVLDWLKKYFTADYSPWFSIYQPDFSQYSQFRKKKKKVFPFWPKYNFASSCRIKAKQK